MLKLWWQRNENFYRWDAGEDGGAQNIRSHRHVQKYKVSPLSSACVCERRGEREFGPLFPLNFIIYMYATILNILWRIRCIIAAYKMAIERERENHNQNRKFHTHPLSLDDIENVQWYTWIACSTLTVRYLPLSDLLSPSPPPSMYGVQQHCAQWIYQQQK